MTNSLRNPNVTVTEHPTFDPQAPLKHLWQAHGYDPTIQTTHIDASVVLKSCTVWKTADFHKFKAVVIVLSEKDIPTEHSDTILQQFANFFLRMATVSQIDIIFAGYALRENQALDKGTQFFDTFAHKHAASLYKLSDKKIHVIDLVSAPHGSAKWFGNAHTVPAWEAVMNAGFIHTLTHIFTYGQKHIGFHNKPLLPFS